MGLLSLITRKSDSSGIAGPTEALMRRLLGNRFQVLDSPTLDVVNNSLGKTHSELVKEARAIYQRNGYAKNWVKNRVDNVVGPHGPQVIWTNDAPEQLQQLWQNFSNNADGSNHSLAQILRESYKGYLRDGDALTVISQYPPFISNLYLNYVDSDKVAEVNLNSEFGTISSFTLADDAGTQIPSWSALWWNEPGLTGQRRGRSLLLDAAPDLDAATTMAKLLDITAKKAVMLQGMLQDATAQNEDEETIWESAYIQWQLRNPDDTRPKADVIEELKAAHTSSFDKIPIDKIVKMDNNLELVGTSISTVIDPTLAELAIKEHLRSASAHLGNSVGAVTGDITEGVYSSMRLVRMDDVLSYSVDQNLLELLFRKLLWWWLLNNADWSSFPEDMRTTNGIWDYLIGDIVLQPHPGIDLAKDIMAHERAIAAGIETPEQAGIALAGVLFPPSAVSSNSANSDTTA